METENTKEVSIEITRTWETVMSHLGMPFTVPIDDCILSRKHGAIAN